MLEINDIIIYTTYGICKIKDKITMNLNGNNEYFVLVPLTDAKTEITIPTANQLIMSRVLPLLKKDEILTIINEIPFIDTFWIDNDNERKKEFSDIIKKGDRRQTLKLIKSIKSHQNGLKGKGRKLHATDEAAMKDALKLILDEFSYVLDRDRNDVLNELNIIFEK